MTYAERATDYARNVVKGRILACRLTRLSCQRHLDDLEASEDPDYPFEFEVESAGRVLDFMSRMPHVKGRWARRRERLRLEDWMCFVYGVPFGWVRRRDGLRRYRRTYNEIPRKNGKSTGTAALGNYMFAADDEHGAEVYSGAGTESQAWEVFGPARLMAKNTPPLCEAFGIRVGAKNLHIIDTASKFQPIIGKPGDGASPSFAITDEYHEHDTSEQYDTMITGMGSREQPMSWVITTAGSSTAGPCYALRSELVDVLEGRVRNDELWGVIYTIDDDTDWTSEEALEMSNPNIGVSVDRGYLRQQQKDAINSPRKQATFKMKHLNVWSDAAVPYFNAQKWDDAADPELAIEQFEGEACWVGLDLASKRDLTCKVNVFKRTVEETDHYYFFCTSYLPKARATDPALAHYVDWAERGCLVVTDGNITDYNLIEDEVKDESERFRIVSVRFDPYNATHVITNLMAEGINCVEVHQNVRNLSDPMKWLEALIVAGRVHHTGDPVLSWGIKNITAKEDRNENVYPRKEHPEKKIDPGVASIMALSGALSDDGTPPPPPEIIMLEDGSGRGEVPPMIEEEIWW